MAFETTGIIKVIFPTESRSDKFSSRDFVLEIPDGNYPQLIKFQAVQERCGLLDQFTEGEQVTVHFDLRGREWNGKYLTNLNAWKIVGQAGEKSEKLPPPKKAVEPINSNPDDLPF